MDASASTRVEGRTGLEEFEASSVSSARPRPRGRLLRLGSRPGSCESVRVSSSSLLGGATSRLDGVIGVEAISADGTERRELRRAEAGEDVACKPRDAEFCGVTRRAFASREGLASGADFLGRPGPLLVTDTSGESDFRRMGLAVSLTSSSSRLWSAF